MGICESKIPSQNHTKTQPGNTTPTEKGKRNAENVPNPVPNQTKTQPGNISQTENGQRNKEKIIGPKPIPLDIVDKAKKSICKIMVKINNSAYFGTGFFMNISESKKYLITNYHIINPDVINNDIIIGIHNNKKMKLNFNNRDIKYFPEPKDITIIEMKNYDDIYNDIKFLDYDINYIQRGYNIYKKVDVFSIEHPLGNSAACAGGQILHLNEFEFAHNISTNKGSSGCPIILLNNNINSIQVIGIHKEEDDSDDFNYGTFIGEIFNNKKYTNKLNINNSINNYIIAEIEIKDRDINKDIRIINSYEEQYRKWKIKEIKKEEMNEGEIKKCEIRINNILIPFNYYYRFPKKGKYEIKYSFNQNLTKTNYMFCECGCFTSFDLSNFNTQNVTNMQGMFSNCYSVVYINLTKLNTQNVTDISDMFYWCTSLTNIDLSNFNTQNITYMSSMFYFCQSLTNIDLSNFNTQNVTDMSFMFYFCSSLININLSNFNTQNVTNMSNMFGGCRSLKKQNVITNDKKILERLK